MKKILCLLTIFAFVVALAPVQAQTPTPNDPTSYMTAEQLAKYHADNKLAEVKAVHDLQVAEYEKKIKQFGDWVGVGGEVGTAINEGLTAVVDVADKFGKTDVGKFTLVLVAWKVMGKDVVKIVLGLLFFAVLVTLLSRFYRRTVTDRKLLKLRTPQGFWKRDIKEYEIIESNLEGEEKAWLTAGIIVAFLLGIWITYGVMF
jgi:hypothetical protein